MKHYITFAQYKGDFEVILIAPNTYRYNDLSLSSMDFPFINNYNFYDNYISSEIISMDIRNICHYYFLVKEVPEKEFFEINQEKIMNKLVSEIKEELNNLELWRK